LGHGWGDASPERGGEAGIWGTKKART